MSPARSGFVSNAVERGSKVVTTLVEELSRARRFSFCVSFILESGVACLKGELAKYLEAGLTGRILTSDYLYVTQPAALRHLLELDGIEVRMYSTLGRRAGGFHSKGYMFSRDDDGKAVSIMIGSANMSQAALTSNREWNAFVESDVDSDFVRGVIEEFEHLWSHERTQPLARCLDEYERRYNAYHAGEKHRVTALEIEELPPEPVPRGVVPTPNPMQEAFVGRLLELERMGEEKALLIAATGTGKTYAAAFGVKALRAERFLFVAHRREILEQAREAFTRVLGEDFPTACFVGSGAERYEGEPGVFATVQTLTRSGRLASFPPEYFDVVVVDEAHHATAGTYKAVTNHFRPRFLLGLTATPERGDAADVFARFDHNVAYEIRLSDALEEGMLCDFHYYGLTDIEFEGDEDAARDFARLSSPQRLRHILEGVRCYRTKSTRPRGLVFCSSLEEADWLARAFTAAGEPAVMLSGRNSPEERLRAVEALERDGDEGLRYIMTVDVFNEGVDIRRVNQIVFLRPTESPVVFTQQLGRGLRRCGGKPYVSVVDFISNYKSNYLIPIALSGDRSYEKSQLRRWVRGGSPLTPGSSTIQFSRLARERVLRSLDGVNLNSARILREGLFELYRRLDRVPSLLDYLHQDVMHPGKFLENKLGRGLSYWSWAVGEINRDRRRRGRTLLPATGFSGEEEKMLVFAGRYFGSARRPGEGVLLSAVARGEERPLEDVLREALEKACPKGVPAHEVDSTLACLDGSFWKGKPDVPVLIERIDGHYHPSRTWRAAVGRNPALKSALAELGAFITAEARRREAERYLDTEFVLHQEYNYEEVERLLGWRTFLNGGAVGGYAYDGDSRTLPVFINYEKLDDAVGYGDVFLSKDRLKAHSKGGRGLGSADVAKIYGRPPFEDRRLFLFVRKKTHSGSGEVQRFIFLGELDTVGGPVPETAPDGKGGSKPVFAIEYRLETPLTDELFTYFNDEGDVLVNAQSHTSTATDEDAGNVVDEIPSTPN